MVPIPIACFIGALLTDIAYVASAEIMWADFSAQLLVVGVIFGVLAAVAGLTSISSAAAWCGRSRRPWPHLIGNAVALSPRDLQHDDPHARWPWTSVWPTGLVLSAVAVPVLPFTGWLGWSMVYRHGVGCAMMPSIVRALSCAALLCLAGCNDGSGDQRANRFQSQCCGIPAISDAADPHCSHRRLEEERDAYRRAGAWKAKAVCNGLAASAFSLRSTQWRRAGGGVQGAEEAPIQRPKEFVMGYIEVPGRHRAAATPGG